MPAYVDTFAGPGGWEKGASMLGLDGVGIELDPVACATRAAAGLHTIRGDVAALEPRLIPRAAGFLASPVCPTFSAAGSGSGRRDLPLLLEALEQIEQGRDPRPGLRAAVADLRTVLTVEPLRWTLARRPEWTCWEQVKEVLPVWEACAAILRRTGYSVWTGKLSAEEYGVPQTRVRAVLIASRTRTVGRPTATHQRYRYGKPPEPTGLPAYVTMAAALGWGMTDRPAMTFSPGTAQGGADAVGGSGARRRIHAEQDAGRWIEPPADDWPFYRPATTLQGDPRVFRPGGHHANDGRRSRADVNGRSRAPIRVSVQDAGILQSFPADYPWQGTRTQQYQQVGNAVPPLLAAAVIGEATGRRP